MINLVTGLPGASKTLYTLSMVDAEARKDQRPVFYSGITEVTLPGWTEIEAEDWYNCPPKSIIVIDECQRIFRPRMNGKEVPKFVSELETHRHKGLDLYMITQHPMLADSALRRLSGRHFHVVRVMGMQVSTVHEWPSVKDTCDKSSSRVDSIKHRWPFNKEMFGKYKSAEIHTVKRTIPTRVKLFVLLPFLFAIIGYFVWASFQKKINPQAVPVSSSQVQVAPGSAASGGGPVKASYVNAVADAKQFAFERTSRVEGLPQTAPRYDEVTKPTVAPVPVACVADEVKCVCYSQQATKMQVTRDTCRQIVEQGFFRDFEDKRSDQVARSREVLNRSDPLPLSGVSTKQAEGRNYGAIAAVSSPAPGGGSQQGRDASTFGVVASRRDGVRVPTEN